MAFGGLKKLAKKAAKGVKKIAKKNAGGAKRLIKKVGPGIALAAIGSPAAVPLIAKAASKAKSFGKKVRGIETPKSLAPVIKQATIRVKRTRSKMPGGAPMPRIEPVSVRGITKSTPQAKRTLYTTKKKSTKKTKAKSTTKKPPSAAQLAARQRFAEMAKARAKAKKAA